MSRKAVSVTLDEMNLTWLRGRARVISKGNLSEALDRLLTDARTGGRRTAVRSAVGLTTLPPDDPDLAKVKAAVRQLFEESLSRPLLVREDDGPYGAQPTQTRRKRAGARRG